MWVVISEILRLSQAKIVLTGKDESFQSCLGEDPHLVPLTLRETSELTGVRHGKIPMVLSFSDHE